MHRVSPAPDDADHERDEPPGAGDRTHSGGWAPPCLVAPRRGRGRCGLWDWRPGTPFGLDGDSTVRRRCSCATSPTTAGTGTTPTSAYPFGQNGSMFPELNVLHVLASSRRWVSSPSSPYTPGVVYFVLGFPLAAVAMYALARSQGLSRWAALRRRRAVRERAGPPGTLRPPVAGRLLGRARSGMWVVLEVLRGRRFFERARRRTASGLAAGARTWLTVARDGRDRPERRLLRGVHPGAARRGQPSPGGGRRARPRGWAPGIAVGALPRRGPAGPPRGRQARDARRGHHRPVPARAGVRRDRDLRRQDDGPGPALDRAPPRPARLPDLRLQRRHPCDRRDVGARRGRPRRVARRWSSWR